VAPHAVTHRLLRPVGHVRQFWAEVAAIANEGLGTASYVIDLGGCGAVVIDRLAETGPPNGEFRSYGVLAVLTDLTRVPDGAPAVADAAAGGDQLGGRVWKDGRDFTVRVVTKADVIRVVPRPGGGSLIAWCVPAVAGLHVLAPQRFRGQPHEGRQTGARLSRFLLLGAWRAALAVWHGGGVSLTIPGTQVWTVLRRGKARGW